MARDDFKPKTIEKLRTRVAYRCSNPSCRVPTVAPGTGEEDITNAGVACHIAAAALGGPRYAASMHPQERSAITNGIWLCAICARVIDADVAAHPPTLLHEWKRGAEQQAREEIGTKLPRKEDALDAVMAVFTGQSPQFTRTAIANVHKAAQSRLNSLDPRLHVETQFVNGATTCVIHAREQFDLGIHVPAEIALEWRRGVGDAICHGIEVNLPGDGLRIVGSPLFDELMQPSATKGSTITIGGSKKEAILRVDLRRELSGEVRPFRELHGALTYGIESFSFDGSACGGLFSMGFRFLWRDMIGTQTFRFGSGFLEWDSKDVRFLPYFDTLYELYQYLDDGWRFHITLEMEGHTFLHGLSNTESATEILRDTRLMLDHVSRVRELANFMDEAIKYSMDSPLNYEERQKVAEVVATIKGERQYKRTDLSEDPSISLIINDDGQNMAELLASETPTNICVEWAGDEVSIFGTLVRLPRMEIHFRNVFPELGVDLQSIRKGDEIRIVWRRMDDFVCEFRYLKPQEVALVDS